MKRFGILMGIMLASVIAGCGVDAQGNDQLSELRREVLDLGSYGDSDTDYPDTDQNPDTDYPDTDQNPDTDYPDTDQNPDTDYPDTDQNPDTDYPDTDYPDTDYPDTDYPDTDTLVQPVWCELDWNCDDVVDGDDWLKDENNGFYSGFIGDMQTYYQYHATYPEYVNGGYYHEFVQCGFPSSLDWNGNGIVDGNYKDARNGEPAAHNLNTFYTQHWVFITYPAYYHNYYPTSACNSWL